MTSVVSAPTAVPSGKLWAHLAMLLFAALIAASFSLGALAVPYLAPGPLNLLRFLIASGVMAVLTFGIARQPPRLPAAPWRFVLLGLFFAVYFITMFIALTMTAPVATSAIFTLIPLMTAFTGWVLLRQRARPLVLVSLLIAGIGSAWVIFRGDLGALLAFDLGPGERIFLIGCVAYALYTPLMRKFGRGEPGLVFSFWIIVSATVWFALYSAPELAGVDWAALPPIVWLSALYLAVGPTAAAVFLTQYASRRLPAARVIAYGYLTPVFVILIEGIAGHGWSSLPVLAGALVTVLALAVLAVAPE